MSFSSSRQFKQLEQSLSRLILSGALLLVAQLPALAGQCITLTWSLSDDPGVVGYKIHYGTESSTYTQVVDVGNTNTTTLNLPFPGVTYYIAATAYDRSGNESDFSNETSYATPSAATLTTASLSSGQFSFSVNGTSGAIYIVQASTNLVDWFAVQTNRAPFVFTDMNASETEHCFYRAVSP